MTTETISMTAPKPVEVIMPQPKACSRYDARISDMQAAHAAGDNVATAQHMVCLLGDLEQDMRAPTHKVRAEIVQAVHAFLGVFCRPDFVVPEAFSVSLLRSVTTIANAVACGGEEATTDAYIASLDGQDQALYKTVVLTSPRNYRMFDLDKLYDVAPELASAWYCQAWKTAFAGNASRRVRDNLESLRYPDERFVHTQDIQEPYFLVTYLGNGHLEAFVKSAINKAVKRVAPKIEPGKPRRRIAVVSDLWSHGHSVHRSLCDYIKELSEWCDLTLVHSIRDKSELDTSMFEDTIQLHFADDKMTLDATPLNGQGFAAVVFPDIGMTPTSIILANTRIAPVQVMLTGHPVSTFGAEIDYFVVGDRFSSEMVEMHEKFAPIPGFGATHCRPTYVPKRPKKTFDGIVINASWASQKISAPFLKLVNSAIAQGGAKVKLNIFPSNGAVVRCGFGPFLDSIGKIMTACEVVVHDHLSYDEYMEVMEQGDFAIDCYPFAGSNTVSDNLWLRKPVVALEGDQWYNKIGPAMLRSVGLGELVANTRDGFAGKIIAMIRYKDIRDKYTEVVECANLDNSSIYDAEGADDFAEWLAGEAGIKSRKARPNPSQAVPAAH